MFTRKFEEIFEKILGNLRKSLRNCEENFKNFKEIYEKICGRFKKKIEKNQEKV